MPLLSASGFLFKFKEHFLVSWSFFVYFPGFPGQKTSQFPGFSGFSLENTSHLV